MILEDTIERMRYEKREGKKARKGTPDTAMGTWAQSHWRTWGVSVEYTSGVITAKGKQLG